MARYDLAKFRKEQGLTQKELADILEVSQGFMSSIENGRNPLPEERVGKLYRAFPEIDFEIYRIEENESVIKINSDNQHSPININAPETIKALLEYMERYRDKKGNGDSMEINSVMHGYLKLVDCYEEQRNKIDKYQQQIFDLNNEILRLKGILIENGIKF